MPGDLEWGQGAHTGYCVHREPPSSSLWHKKPLLPPHERLTEGMYMQRNGTGTGAGTVWRVPSALGKLSKGEMRKGAGCRMSWVHKEGPSSGRKGSAQLGKRLLLPTHPGWPCLSCQVKLERLVTPVCPVKKGTSRTPPPPAPAAGPTPGECGCVPPTHPEAPAADNPTPVLNSIGPSLPLAPSSCVPS